MKTTKVLLGARIKELRKVKKLSQDKLSEKITIDPKHLSRIEVGKSYPSLDTLEKIAESLGVEIKEFFEFKHQEGNKELVKNIGEFLKIVDDEKLRLIFKIIRAVAH